MVAGQGGGQERRCRNLWPTLQGSDQFAACILLPQGLTLCWQRGVHGDQDRPQFRHSPGKRRQINKASCAMYHVPPAACLAENVAKAKAANHGKPFTGGDKHRPRHARGAGGGAKKGGAGGKFIWGSMFTNGADADGVLDRNDPNYDSEEERHVVLKTQQSRLKAEVQAYKLEVRTYAQGWRHWGFRGVVCVFGLGEGGGGWQGRGGVRACGGWR